MLHGINAHYDRKILLNNKLILMKGSFFVKFLDIFPLFFFFFDFN